MRQNKETAIGELAMMVQRGFEGVTSEINSVKDEMNGMKNEVNEIKEQMHTIVRQIDILQHGQVRIEDRLDDIGPQMKENEKRITILEKKAFFAR